MTTAMLSYCQMEGCSRFRGPQFGPMVDPVFTCDAFPLGIPDDILSGANKHTSPVEGDGGMQYDRDAALIRVAEKSISIPIIINEKGVVGSGN